MQLKFILFSQNYLFPNIVPKVDIWRWANWSCLCLDGDFSQLSHRGFCQARSRSYRSSSRGLPRSILASFTAHTSTLCIQTQSLCSKKWTSGFFSKEIKPQSVYWFSPNCFTCRLWHFVLRCARRSCLLPRWGLSFINHFAISVRLDRAVFERVCASVSDPISPPLLRTHTFAVYRNSNALLLLNAQVCSVFHKPLSVLYSWKLGFFVIKYYQYKGNLIFWNYNNKHNLKPCTLLLSQMAWFFWNTSCSWTLLVSFTNLKVNIT